MSKKLRNKHQRESVIEQLIEIRKKYNQSIKTYLLTNNYNKQLQNTVDLHVLKNVAKYVGLSKSTANRYSYSMV